MILKFCENYVYKRNWYESYVEIEIEKNKLLINVKDGYNSHGTSFKEFGDPFSSTVWINCKTVKDKVCDAHWIE